MRHTRTVQLITREISSENGKYSQAVMIGNEANGSYRGNSTDC